MVDAVIVVDGAVLAAETGRAHARVVAHLVHAGGIIPARIGRAVIHVRLAAFPCTRTPRRGSNMRTPVGAKERSSPFTAETIRTLAEESVALSGAGGVVHARRRLALVVFLVAVQTLPARFALARVFSGLDHLQINHSTSLFAFLLRSSYLCSCSSRPINHPFHSFQN